MKKIVYKKNGESLGLYEALALVRSVKMIYPWVQHDEHRNPHGRTSSSIAEKDLPAIIEAHEGYISIFEGTEDCGFEGVKAVFIGFKRLPDDFETRFSNYVVINE